MPWRAASRSASASLRCSRAIDNGKPIRETRDIDIPLVARHFYHHAGWAPLIDANFPAPSRSASAGRSYPGISAADAGVEIAPRSRRKYGGAQACRVHADDRARLRRNCVEAGLPPAWSTSSPATAHRRGSRGHEGVDKVAFTGSTEVGRDIVRPQRGRARSSRSSSAANRRSSCSMMPTSRARSRAWSTRSGSTRGRFAARVRGCWSPKASRRNSCDKLRARMSHLIVGDPLDKSTDIGAIVAPMQLERIQGLVEAGRAKAVRSTSRGAFRRADGSIRRRSSTGVEPASLLRAKRSSARCW